MPEYTVPHSIYSPLPDDRIKDANTTAKLQEDISKVAATTNTAIATEGARAESDAVAASAEYTGKYGDELSAEILDKDFVLGRAVSTRIADSVYRHTTETGELLPLGYDSEGHLDAHARRIWKQDIVNTNEVGRHPEYAHIVATPGGDLLMGFRWDGGIEAPGMPSSRLTLDTASPVGGHAVVPTISEQTKWTTIGSSSSQHFGAAVAPQVAALGVQLAQMGKAGERIEHIEARWGSTPALLTVAGGVIPASGSVTVTAENVPASANMLPFVGKLAGVRGTLSSTASAMTFTRTAAGTATSVPVAEKFYPEVSETRRSDLLINDSGKNNLSTEGGAALVIAGTRRMLQHLAPLEKRFVVIDHFVDTGQASGGVQATQVAGVNAAYYAAYGSAVVRRSDWLAGSAVWAQVGLTPTTADLAAQASRTLPPSLSKDAAHMSDAAHLAFYTHVLLPKLVEFGWTPGFVRKYTIDQTAGRTVKVWDYLNNREQLIYGDTGDRDISSSLTNSTGKAVVSRMGNTVTLDLMGVTPTSALASGSVFLSIPSGFRSPIRRDMPLAANALGNVTRSCFIFANGGMGLWLPATSDVYRITISYRTNDPWPTSLPGVAA